MERTTLRRVTILVAVVGVFATALVTPVKIELSGDSLRIREEREKGGNKITNAIKDEKKKEMKSSVAPNLRIRVPITSNLKENIDSR